MINKQANYNILCFIQLKGYQNTTGGTSSIGTGTWYSSAWHELSMVGQTASASQYVPRTIIDRRWITIDGDVYNIAIGIRTVSGNGYVCTGGFLTIFIINGVL